MKKQATVATPLIPVHIVQKELLQPYNPIAVNLIGAGGTGSQMLTALARMSQALNGLNHPGFMVTLFDDDTVQAPNLARQLFTTGELGQFKSVALINRVNRFFGLNWKAVTERYDKDYCSIAKGMAPLTISCVDTVKARFEIADILDIYKKNTAGHRDKPLYWMDFGNSKETGQVLLSTIGDIKQPSSKQFSPTANLPYVTDEYKDLLIASEQTDNTPSCSLAEALAKQDLFINSALANLGASLLWQMFREGILYHKGFFLNLKEFRTQPLKIA
ncbi:PRTRC system ThiF family protein [Mucilaginibacter sp. SMC90]|uniref:PRTRC system ThiF family protein n=1 Tax=Mucilaginibacter sp. SMC90 TaxID=2929803 RepID=UPI001FB2C009|nr:PRTRC system ThiF family protein [Mucilaginibacter sp. SMC90]UOE52549.1 PRTRC system ThiF family protein [Mucilaginibacter sp. SMC90]